MHSGNEHSIISADSLIPSRRRTFTSSARPMHLSPGLSCHLSLSTFIPLLTFAVISLSCRVHCYDQRPFYNIAHMVNSIKEVNYYLSKGANAIEADVAFSPNGTALYTFHGYPCDCFRHCTELENLVKYLEYVREVTSTGKQAVHDSDVLFPQLLPPCHSTADCGGERHYLSSFFWYK